MIVHRPGPPSGPSILGFFAGGLLCAYTQASDRSGGRHSPYRGSCEHQRDECRAAPSPGAAVVINEVYGGGGNAARRTTGLHRAGTTITAARSTSTAGRCSTPPPRARPGRPPPLTGTHARRRRTTSCARPPAPAAPRTSPSTSTGTIAMSGTAGKVALVNSTAAPAARQRACSEAAAGRRLRRLRRDRQRLRRHRPHAGTEQHDVGVAQQHHANTANNAADFTAGDPHPPAPGAACPVTPAARERTIAEIQGTGAASPHVGKTVITRASSPLPTRPAASTATSCRPQGTGGPIDRARHGASDGPLRLPAGARRRGRRVGDTLQVTGAVSEFTGSPS